MTVVPPDPICAHCDLPESAHLVISTRQPQPEEYDAPAAAGIILATICPTALFK